MNITKTKSLTMTVDQFYEILIKEMEENEELRKYHRLFKTPAFYELRKAYFRQRLQYLIDRIDNYDSKVWDLGCGYGTTSLFLAMNGIRVHGTTIGDHYFNGIPRRLEYWKQYGDSSLFTYSYEYLFDSPPPPETYDYVILQDTLHHLEPVDQVFNILYNALTSGGKVIILEANGKNIIHKLKLYYIRKDNNILEVFDKRLNKTIQYGNENFRSVKKWNEIMNQHNFSMEDLHYIKFFLPFVYNGKNTNNIVWLEQQLWKASPFLRDYFFFGMNFVAKKW